MCKSLFQRIPECVIFGVGALFRLTMIWRFDATWGYDAVGHLKYIEWLTKHPGLPGVSYNYLAYHPPLYHFTAALLDPVYVSIACGIVRLALIWLGLEWYLENRRARIFGLALAAVLPVSAHL